MCQDTTVGIQLFPLTPFDSPSSPSLSSRHAASAGRAKELTLINLVIALLKPQLVEVIPFRNEVDDWKDWKQFKGAKMADEIGAFVGQVPPLH